MNKRYLEDTIAYAKRQIKEWEKLIKEFERQLKELKKHENN